jgi:cob(I)alamin adenosyltransferase
MAITTKRGDNGKTCLFGPGPRVFKDDPCVEAMGALDELCAFLGLAKSLSPGRIFRRHLEVLQAEVLSLCRQVAAQKSASLKHKSSINQGHLKRLENIIAGLERGRPYPRGCFCLSGSTPLFAALDVARAVARRAERCLVSYLRARRMRNPDMIAYINRLSDVLFLMARSKEKRRN